MLEAWIVADERAVSRFLSTAAHPVEVKRHRAPESIRDPKAALMEVFRKSGSRFNRYTDYVHAFSIAQHAISCGLDSRIAKLATFSSFKSLVA